MAFQVSDIKISGTIDGISFYHSVFGWLVRTKGGPSRKQFKTSPNFARSRENSEEFTACSKAAAAVRRNVLIHTGNKDKNLYRRLTKLMRLLANEDRFSLRGQRDPFKGMQSPEGKVHLKDFEITIGLNLYDVLFTAGLLHEPQPEIKALASCQKPGTSSTIKRKRKKKFNGGAALKVKSRQLGPAGNTKRFHDLLNDTLQSAEVHASFDAPGP